MKRYEPNTPRVAFGIIAVVVAAITLGLLVVLPAELEMGIPNAVIAAAHHVLS